MTEFYENLFQVIITGGVAAAASVRAVRSRKREWVLMALFSGTYCMADLYWVLYILFYHHSPALSVLSDLGWYASMLFLLLLVVRVQGNCPFRYHTAVMWLIPVFTFGMCIFYSAGYGAYLSNITAAVLMTMIIRRSVGCALQFRGRPGEATRGWHGFYRWVLLFCTAEYAMWTSSCIGWTDAWYNPYFLFDVVLSISFVLILTALGKAAGGELY